MNKAEAQDNANNAAKQIEDILTKHGGWVRHDNNGNIIYEIDYKEGANDGLVAAKILTMPF